MTHMVEVIICTFSPETAMEKNNGFSYQYIYMYKRIADNIEN